MRPRSFLPEFGVAFFLCVPGLPVDGSGREEDYLNLFDRSSE